MNYKFTNEIVFRGHPDKICDQIAGEILTRALRQDPDSRIGIEVLIKNRTVVLAGEVTTKASIDYRLCTDRVLKRLGHNPSDFKILKFINRQSPDIARGVDRGGAGDNGIMFGFASFETPSKLPKAHLILQELARKYHQLSLQDSAFLSDGKAQITGLYDDGKLLAIEDFVICYQNPETERKRTDGVLAETAKKICDTFEVEVKRLTFNPTGAFKTGGPEADCGLTGRKIVVDTYQGFAPVGGGSMNGKDPTKVDVSGAYAARELACLLLDAFPVKSVTTQLAYAIGREDPQSIVAWDEHHNLIPIPHISLKPRDVIERLGLLNYNYSELAAYGHFTG